MEAAEACLGHRLETLNNLSVSFNAETKAWARALNNARVLGLPEQYTATDYVDVSGNFVLVAQLEAYHETEAIPATPLDVRDTLPGCACAEFCAGRTSRVPLDPTAPEFRPMKSANLNPTAPEFQMADRGQGVLATSINVLREDLLRLFKQGNPVWESKLLLPQEVGVLCTWPSSCKTPPRGPWEDADRGSLSSTPGAAQWSSSPPESRPTAPSSTSVTAST